MYPTCVSSKLCEFIYQPVTLRSEKALVCQKIKLEDGGGEYDHQQYLPLDLALQPSCYPLPIVIFFDLLFLLTFITRLLKSTKTILRKGQVRTESGQRFISNCNIFFVEILSKKGAKFNTQHPPCYIT